MTKTELSFDAPFEKKISRLFVFRFLALFIEVWILYVWMIWMAILMFIHFWYMIILGERSEGIWQRKLRFTRHVAKWNAYLTVLIDKRPEWIED